MKILFKDKWKSYLLILFFGILMGVMSGLTARLSDDGLWAFGNIGTGTLGIWMFILSIIVLGSENRKTAVINTIIFIYSLFFVTAIFRLSDSYLISYATREAPCTLFEYLTNWDAINWYFGYASEIETLLAVIVSPILYFGRKNNWFGKIMRILPLCYLLLEFVSYFCRVILEHNQLFTTIVNFVLIIAYFFFIKDSFKKRETL